MNQQRIKNSQAAIQQAFAALDQLRARLLSTERQLIAAVEEEDGEFPAFVISQENSAEYERGFDAGYREGAERAVGHAIAAIEARQRVIQKSDYGIMKDEKIAALRALKSDIEIAFNLKTEGVARFTWKSKKDKP